MFALMRKTRVFGTENGLDGPSIFRQQCGAYSLNVGHHGHLGYISGPQGALKSTVLRYWAAAALSGETKLTFDFDLSDRCVLLLDGEQPPDIFATAVRQIHTLAGKQDDDRLIAHSLTDYISSFDKQDKLFELAYKYRSDLGLMLIDGGKNFVNSANDEQGCRRFIMNLMDIGKRTGAIIVILSHLSGKKGEERLFGWLGSLLHDLASFGYQMQRSGKYFILREVKTRYAPTSPVILNYGRDIGMLEEMPYYPH